VRPHRWPGEDRCPRYVFLARSAACCCFYCPPRSSLAVSLGLMHITPRALTFAICSHARMRPPLCRRTTLAGPTTLLGDGDTPSCQRAPEDNRSSVPCTMQRKEKGMRMASRKRVRDSFDSPAKTRAPDSESAWGTANTIGQLLL